MEYANGRFLRLLVKLAMVNERPDDNGSLSWSDTGDRYILRLFRDFVFHQKDAQGQNVTDLGHVIDALAKLDVGDAEAIPLCSPDGKTILVCTYEDVRRCLENAYGELTSQTTNPFAAGQAMGERAGGLPAFRATDFVPYVPMGVETGYAALPQATGARTWI